MLAQCVSALLLLLLLPACSSVQLGVEVNNGSERLRAFTAGGGGSWKTLGRWPTAVLKEGSGKLSSDYFGHSHSTVQLQLLLLSESEANLLAQEASSAIKRPVASIRILVSPVQSASCSIKWPKVGQLQSTSSNHSDRLLLLQFTIPVQHRTTMNLIENLQEVKSVSCTIRFKKFMREFDLLLPENKAENRFEDSSGSSLGLGSRLLSALDDNVRFMRDRLRRLENVSSEQVQQLQDAGQRRDRRIQSMDVRLSSVEADAAFAAAAGDRSSEVVKRAILRNFSHRIVRIGGRRFLVIQRRENGSVDFNRGWRDYEEGFGDEWNFWIGLKTISALTARSPTTLRVELTRFADPRRWNDSLKYHAEFLQFRVSPADTAYRMSYLRMDPDSSSFKGDALQRHKNMRFSTFDNDNDPNNRLNCALRWGSGWWFNSCFKVNLNGRYYRSQRRKKDGITWARVHNLSNDYRTFKRVRMLLLLQ